MSHSDAWLRRHAIQIAAQLPENCDQAIKVLDYARLLVDNFMREADQADRRDEPPGGSSPNKRAMSIVRQDERPK